MCAGAYYSGLKGKMISLLARPFIESIVEVEAGQDMERDPVVLNL